MSSSTYKPRRTRSKSNSSSDGESIINSSEEEKGPNE